MPYDFKKRLGQRAINPVVDPVALYKTLDRASDKGPLREPQQAILAEWYASQRKKRDLLIKLHTGQGKTLIGLLLLQSQLHAGVGPALYLCPDKYLVSQTCNQAEQFGIDVAVFEDELPEAFVQSRKILVTTVHKLFNGLSKFGIGAKSQPVGTLLLDDAHACVDIIRNQMVISIKSEEPAYAKLLALFAPDLEAQGMGTFAELQRHEYGALLPVPYWAWNDKQAAVVAILAEHREARSIKFAWPILKDVLGHCTCIVSGMGVEISAQLPPLSSFGSFDKASHRVFMSATVANDAFLVRGLGIDPAAVTAPLAYAKETWSGEKMILVPSLLDESLDRSAIVNRFGKLRENRRSGVVVLVPSFQHSADWKAVGGIVADGKENTVDASLNRLRNGDRDRVVVIANRYDGIDLPDSVCRLLILDSKPFAETLFERHLERCLSDSEQMAMATARKIEQGLGRSVRGEKDYCVFLIVGPDLVRCMRSEATRKYLSAQTRRQVDIGFEVAEMGSENAGDGEEPMDALMEAVTTCLRRDEQWKSFYVQTMNAMPMQGDATRALEQFAKERAAELRFQDGDADGAKKIMQALADKAQESVTLQGWYLQEMARYEYARSKVESNKLQVVAHKRNRSLLRPRDGMVFQHITLVSQRRVENCRKWLAAHESNDELAMAVDVMLSNLRFGSGAEEFESAFDQLGLSLGFVTDRPDRDWKEGPDNLWALRDNQYLLVECKTDVSLERAEIHKSETDQINRSADWFAKNYGEADVSRIMITPAKTVAKAAAFAYQVSVMQETHLASLRRSVKGFFSEFSSVDLRSVGVDGVQSALNAHHLSVEDLCTRYSAKPRILGTA